MTNSEAINALIAEIRKLRASLYGSDYASTEELDKAEQGVNPPPQTTETKKLSDK